MSQPQPERPAELAVGDPFRASTPASSREQPAASATAAAGDDGFGQGRTRTHQSSLPGQDLDNFAMKSSGEQILSKINW